MAAGLSLPAANLDALRQRLNTIAHQTLSPALLQPLLRIDATSTLSDLTIERLEELAKLDPLGQGNPPVHLVAHDLTHRQPPQRIGKDQQHLKMWVSDGAATHEALWWNCDPRNQPDGRFDRAFAPQINEFNGRQRVQLKALDWKPVT